MNKIEEKLQRTLNSIEDSIHSWQSKVRKLTSDLDFRAIPYLAKECNVTTNTFYNKLQGEKNGNKLSLYEFAKIIVATEDLDLIKTFQNEIINQITIKKNK